MVFAHFGTIVFTARTEIGAFFTIYHGCTVGTDDTGKAPKIGNYVTQFAGSHVLGDCLIGSFARIGANAVVLGIQEPLGECSFVGIPAKVRRLQVTTRIPTQI